MGSTPIVTAEDGESYDTAQTVRNSEKWFSTNLNLLMTETTNDDKLLKTLVALERKQHSLIPEEYQHYRRKLSTRYGLVFYEDRVVVPATLRTTVITLLHKGHSAINKMSHAAITFWWPKLTEALERKCETCTPCKMSGKNIKPNLPKCEIKQLPQLDKSNEGIQLDFIGPIGEQNRRFLSYHPWTDIVNGRRRRFAKHLTA